MTETAKQVNTLTVKLLRPNRPEERVYLNSVLLPSESLYHVLRLKYMVMGVPHDITPNDNFTSVTVNILEPYNLRHVAVGNERSQQAMLLLDALFKAWESTPELEPTAKAMYGEAFSLMLSLTTKPIILPHDLKRVGSFFAGPTTLISAN